MRKWTRGLTGLLPVLWSLGCGEPSVPVPGGLIGVWGSEHPEYADRLFEVTTEELFLDTGDGTYASYGIVAVRRGQPPRSFMLEYSVDGGTAFFNVTLADGHLYLTNQPEVRWTRSDESSAPWRS